MPRLDEGEITKQTVERNELEKSNAAKDSVHWFHVEEASKKGPGEGAEDAAKRAKDRNHGKSWGSHFEMCFGKEDGNTGDCRDGIRQKEPCEKEEDNVLQFAG